MDQNNIDHKGLQVNDSKDDLIVITGGGGFIAGNLALYFKNKGFRRIRVVDKKPLYDWYLRVPGVESLCLDVSQPAHCQRACDGAMEVTILRPTWAEWASSSGSGSSA